MNRTALGAVCFFLSAPLFASLSLEQVLLNMENQNKTMQNIKFEFRQEIQFVNASDISEVTGLAIFQKPGQMNIQKNKPQEQLTVSNGKKMWIYTPAYNQVWEGSATRGLGTSFLPKGLVPLDDFVLELRKDFNVRFSQTEKSSGELLWLVAEPKDASSGYRIDLCISTQTWLPTKTVFHSDSARILTELLNTQVNLAIPGSTFRFVPPKGADVIPIP